MSACACRSIKFFKKFVWQFLDLHVFSICYQSIISLLWWYHVYLIFVILGSLRWYLHMWVNSLLFQTLKVCSDRDSTPPVSSVWVSGFLSSYRVTFIFQWVLNFCCWGEGMIKWRSSYADTMLTSLFFPSFLEVHQPWLVRLDFTCGFVAEWRIAEIVGMPLSPLVFFFAIDFNCRLSLAFSWKSVAV